MQQYCCQILETSLIYTVLPKSAFLFNTVAVLHDVACA